MMGPAFVTVHFEPLPPKVRLRRLFGRAGLRLVVPVLLLAFFPLVLDVGPEALGPAGWSPYTDWRADVRHGLYWAAIGTVIAVVIHLVHPGRSCTVTFSERGLHDHSSPSFPIHPWSFVTAAIEHDYGLELRCGYGIGRSVTTKIPPELLLARTSPEYERVRSLIAAHAGARFRTRS